MVGLLVVGHFAMQRSGVCRSVNLKYVDCVKKEIKCSPAC